MKYHNIERDILDVIFQKDLLIFRGKTRSLGQCAVIHGPLDRNRTCI